MKIIFRPLFVIFFSFLALSFSLSMKKSSQQNRQNQESLQLIQQENQRLILQKQELLYKEQLTNQPLTQEKLWRDQKWLKLPDEENLELVGFKVQSTTINEPEPVVITPWEKWQELLF